MKKELDEKLCARFPSIFKDRRGDMRKTAMCWGFSCGDGWFQLLWDLCLGLERVNPEVVAAQVKEKFGGLRFYVYGANEEGHKLIDAAERESYKTCEWCASPEGTTKGSSGWIRTLCPTCRKAEDE